LRGHWTYNNGRVLDTMVTSHYEQLTSEASNSMERFYYTRWYGRTRWESWKKGNYTPDKSCSGPYTEAGGWVREHCREFTRIVPDTRGGFEPRSWPVYQFMGRGNLLLNHDFAVGDFSNWSFTGASSKVIVRNAEGYTSINNNNAHGQFWGAEGATIYQDLGRHAELANGQYMSYGIRAWSTGGPATIHVGVWEFNSVSGNKFNSTSFTIQANMPKLYRGWFNLQANTTSFRYQVYLNPGGNRINLDDAWFTPM
jgi:hypothetical protein